MLFSMNWNIGHQFSFDVSHLQHSIPWHSRRCEIMTWVNFVVLQTSASEVFKYISQKENIRSKIQIIIITQWLETECFPNFLRMSILFIRYMLIIQDTVEILFFRQFCVIELIKTAHIIIRMDSLLFHETEFLLFLELICDVYFKASFGGLLTSLSKLLDINWSCPYCLD